MSAVKAPARGARDLADPDAVDRYKTFHQKDPRRVGRFAAAMSIPHEVEVVGKAVAVMYRSAKIDPETGRPPRGGAQNYIHEHDAGVMLYRPARARSSGQRAEVPKALQRLDQQGTLTLLGECLGLDYDGASGEFSVEFPFRPELYCSPDGRHLLVIQDKREILYLVWGGALGVEARGIVG